MNSSLYSMTIWHKRHFPKVYEFRHKLFMFYLDLDEIETIEKQNLLVGSKAGRLYQFRQEDHIHTPGQDLKEHILSYVRKEGVVEPIKRVMLLTHLRVAGYIFNPVSFYFCFNSDDKPSCVLCEIGNTFKELKYFLLKELKTNQESFHHKEMKYYYISPFTDMDDVLDFHIAIPDERLSIAINVQRQGQKYLYATMKGQRADLTAWRLIWWTLIWPVVTLKVITLIHWHALMLYLIKKLRFHAKEETPEKQRNVFRPFLKG